MNNALLKTLRIILVIIIIDVYTLALNVCKIPIFTLCMYVIHAYVLSHRTTNQLFAFINERRV